MVTLSTVMHIVIQEFVCVWILYVLCLLPVR